VEELVRTRADRLQRPLSCERQGARARRAHQHQQPVAVGNAFVGLLEHLLEDRLLGGFVEAGQQRQHGRLVEGTPLELRRHEAEERHAEIGGQRRLRFEVAAVLAAPGCEPPADEQEAAAIFDRKSAGAAGGGRAGERRKTAGARTGRAAEGREAAGGRALVWDVSEGRKAAGCRRALSWDVSGRRKAAGCRRALVRRAAEGREAAGCRGGSVLLPLRHERRGLIAGRSGKAAAGDPALRTLVEDRDLRRGDAAVRSRTDAELELGDGPARARPENAVRRTGVEAERIEPALNLHAVGAALGVLRALPGPVRLCGRLAGGRSRLNLVALRLLLLLLHLLQDDRRAGSDK